MHGPVDMLLVSKYSLSLTPSPSSWEEYTSLPTLGLAMSPALATKILVDTMWAEALIVLAEFGSCIFSCTHHEKNTSLGASLACPQMRDPGTRPNSDFQPRVTADWLHLSSADLSRASNQMYEWKISVCCLSHWGCWSWYAALLWKELMNPHQKYHLKLHKWGGKL